MNIRQFGDQVLKQKSKPVTKIDKEIKNLVKNLTDTMYDAQGVGLAAVQVGILKRVIVMDISGEGKEFRALINPVTIKAEGENIDEEGCLSLKGVKIPIKRAKKVKVKAIDFTSGKEIVIKADDLFSRALQHEIDHLEGKLIIDRASKEDKQRILQEIILNDDKTR